MAALLMGGAGEEALVEPGDNADLLALKSLAEETPEETAEWAREQGNVAVKEAGEEQKKGRQKQRRQLLLRALELYTQAVEEGVRNPMAQRAVYHSNRAHVHLLLGNNRLALSDALESIRLEPVKSEKAHYRAAKAALALGQWRDALRHCDAADAAAAATAAASAEALAAAAPPPTATKGTTDGSSRGGNGAGDSDGSQEKEKEKEKKEKEKEKKGGQVVAGANADVQRIRREAETKLAEEEAASARSRALVAKAEEVVAAVVQRRVVVGAAQYAEALKGLRPTVDSAGLLHWPVLLCYPEPDPMSVDIVQDFAETDPFSLHLQAMYGADTAPLQWDTHGAYTANAVELYYQTNAARPFTRRQLREWLLEGQAGLLLDDDDDKHNGSTSSGNAGGGQELLQGKGWSWSEWAPKTWCRVKPGDMLADVVAACNHVVAGVPVFYVVSNKSREFRSTFLSGAWSPS